MTNLDFMRTTNDNAFIRILEDLMGIVDNTVHQKMLHDWLKKDVDVEFFKDEEEKSHYVGLFEETLEEIKQRENSCKHCEEPCDQQETKDPQNVNMEDVLKGFIEFLQKYKEDSESFLN